ncbi:hypothetical protein MMC11_003914 [Xylographa trunciseda]|nr:hypothetical protein [Xylographa trunciseda]
MLTRISNRLGAGSPPSKALVRQPGSQYDSRRSSPERPPSFQRRRPSESDAEAAYPIPRQRPPLQNVPIRGSIEDSPTIQQAPRPPRENIPSRGYIQEIPPLPQAPQPPRENVPFRGSIQEVPPIPRAPPLFRENVSFQGSTEEVPPVSRARPIRPKPPPLGGNHPFSHGGPTIAPGLASHSKSFHSRSISKTVERTTHQKEVTKQTLDWMIENLDDPRYHRDPLTGKLNDQVIETDNSNAFDFPDSGIKPRPPQGNKLTEDWVILEDSSSTEKQPICLIFYHVRKGELIWKERYIYPEEQWTDKDFVTHLKREYKRSQAWWGIPMKRIKFFYFVTVIKEEKVIRVKYDEVLPYTGPKTISRVMYLLHHSQNKRKWTRVLHDIANEIREGRRKAHQRLIMVEIVETLNSKAIYFLLGLSVVVSVAAGIVYGTQKSDWPGAFTLSSLLITCLALLLAFFSAGEYFGLDRLVDDQIDIESGKRVDVDSTGITGSILGRAKRTLGKHRGGSPEFKKY